MLYLKCGLRLQKNLDNWSCMEQIQFSLLRYVYLVNAIKLQNKSRVAAGRLTGLGIGFIAASDGRVQKVGRCRGHLSQNGLLLLKKFFIQRKELPKRKNEAGRVMERSLAWKNEVSKPYFTYAYL